MADHQRPLSTPGTCHLLPPDQAGLSGWPDQRPANLASENPLRHSPRLLSAQSSSAWACEQSGPVTEAVQSAYSDAPHDAFFIDHRPQPVDLDDFPSIQNIPQYHYSSRATQVLGASFGENCLHPQLARRCFNCGDPSHSLGSCPGPRNEPLIRLARKLFQAAQQEHADLNGLQPEKPAPMASLSGDGSEEALARRKELASSFCPGTVGRKLREALFWNPILSEPEPGCMDPDRKMPWFSRMEEWGYPPGYSASTDDGLDPFRAVEQRLENAGVDPSWESTEILQVYEGSLGGPSSDDDAQGYNSDEEVLLMLIPDYHTRLNRAPTPPIGHKVSDHSFPELAQLPPLPPSPLKPKRGLKRLVKYHARDFDGDRLPIYNGKMIPSKGLYPSYGVPYPYHCTLLDGSYPYSAQGGPSNRRKHLSQSDLAQMSLFGSTQPSPTPNGAHRYEKSGQNHVYPSSSSLSTTQESPSLPATPKGKGNQPKKSGQHGVSPASRPHTPWRTGPLSTPRTYHHNAKYTTESPRTHSTHLNPPLGHPMLMPPLPPLPLPPIHMIPLPSMITHHPQVHHPQSRGPKKHYFDPDDPMTNRRSHQHLGAISSFTTRPFFLPSSSSSWWGRAAERDEEMCGVMLDYGQDESRQNETMKERERETRDRDEDPYADRGADRDPYVDKCFRQSATSKSRFKHVVEKRERNNGEEEGEKDGDEGEGGDGDEEKQGKQQRMNAGDHVDLQEKQKKNEEKKQKAKKKEEEEKSGGRAKLVIRYVDEDDDPKKPGAARGTVDSQSSSKEIHSLCSDSQQKSSCTNAAKTPATSSNSPPYQRQHQQQEEWSWQHALAAPPLPILPSPLVPPPPPGHPNQSTPATFATMTGCTTAVTAPATEECVDMVISDGSPTFQD